MEKQKTAPLNPALNNAARLDLSHFKAVRCNACDADDYEILAVQSRFGIPLKSAICRRCGLMYLNPRMSEAQYKQFYKETYRKFLNAPKKTSDIFLEELREGGEIWEFCQPYIYEGRAVLEIGCGPGGILAAFKNKGCDVRGIEPSLEESVYAQNQGIPVETFMLEDMPIEESAFDLIVLSRSLNHIADPLGALRRVHKLLKTSGVLYLKLLDFPAQCRFGWITECAQADHLYMFTPETISYMLELAGFKINKLKLPDCLSRERIIFPKIPTYHMQILAQKNLPAARLYPLFPDYRKIKRRLWRNQLSFRARRLTYWSTYRHWLALAIKVLAGESGLTTIKQRLSHWGLLNR